jgi:hypothetical protein
MAVSSKHRLFLLPSISFVSGLQHLAAETASCIHDKAIFVSVSVLHEA